MKTTHTFIVHFWLKKKSIRKDGTTPIYTRVTVNGKRVSISLKLKSQFTLMGFKAAKSKRQ